MVAPPQASCAVAIPVPLVPVFAGHSNVRSAGTVSTGAVVSFTVMVWTPVDVLPHWSTAFQFLVITFVPPQPALTLSVKVTAAVPQASVAVAIPVALVAVLAGHSTVRSVGIVITGGMVSFTVIVCSAVETFPHWSTALQ